MRLVTRHLRARVRSVNKLNHSSPSLDGRSEPPIIVLPHVSPRHCHDSVVHWLKQFDCSIMVLQGGRQLTSACEGGSRHGDVNARRANGYLPPRSVDSLALLVFTREDLSFDIRGYK